MNNLLLRLAENRRTGSKPRCHWLLHGNPDQVAGRLTELIRPFGRVSSEDKWLPQGFDVTDEPQLHLRTNVISDDSVVEAFRAWWFKIYKGNRQKSANFDIAATCSIGDQKGILLVEAKAHTAELDGELAGKWFAVDATEGERTNHDNIGNAVDWTNGLLQQSTAISTWALSRDRCYQLSNRFASACKLADLGYSVILMYLGFLGAEEMRNGTDVPYQSCDDWKRHVLDHSKGLVPEEVWESSHTILEKQLIPIIRCLRIPHDRPVEDEE